MIDAPCGAGKTSWAIQEMTQNEDKPYIYCTPFLDEITRIREGCGRQRFKEPLPYSGSKIDDFNDLLALGESIAVSHVTFLNATPETLERIHQGGYTLILDEVLDVICEFNKIQSVEDNARQSISPDDVAMLIDKGMITIAPDYKVTWCGTEYGPDFKNYEVMKMAKLGRLYCARNRLFVTIYPPEMFRQFERVFVLTYMFDGSLLKPYFELFHLPYELASISSGGDGYSLTPYCDDADRAFRQRCKELITVCDRASLNRPKRSLSKSWYEAASAEKLKELKNDILTYFNRHLKTASASNGDIMWTCPADFKNKVSGKGFTCARSMTKGEKHLPEQERKELEKRLDCFVPCNAKATNIYGERWALAYCCNMYLRPMIKGFFDDSGVEPNERAYALSCLIQWLCRSRIRNGEPIEMYVPSKRMRDLLLAWMN